MSRPKGNKEIAVKPDKEEMEADLSSLREELNYRLICEMLTSNRLREHLLWVESISVTVQEQAQNRIESREAVSVWRRILNYFRRKGGMEYGNR